jgi:ribosomal protein L7/L12
MDALQPLADGLGVSLPALALALGLLLGAMAGYVLRGARTDTAVDPMARFAARQAAEAVAPQGAVAPPATSNLPPDDLERIRAMLNERQTIAAIKFLRERTGIGLAEAKAAVDEMKRTGKRS